MTTAQNATAALQLLRERTVEYDLVLSDVYMPGEKQAGGIDSGWGQLLGLQAPARRGRTGGAAEPARASGA